MLLTEERKTEIYREFHPKVQNFLWGKVNNRLLAEDLASDVFLKIYQKIDSFDETKSSLSTWIFTITRNTLIDYYRTRHVTSEMPEQYEGDNDTHLEEMQQSLADALETLDERERNLIILRYYSGYSLGEIAEKMGISYSYVKILHNKALAALKINLGDE